MSNPTDFVDLDLTRRNVGKDGMIDPMAARRAAAANLDRMGRQRERLEDQVATAAQELERLRQRQQDIETQKKTLEEIRSIQQDFLREKKKLAQRLDQSLVLLEKEEVRVSRLSELYRDSRVLFDGLNGELELLDEESWREEAFEEDLVKSNDRLKALRKEFAKGLARLDALGWTPETAEAGEEELLDDRGFFHWMKIGFAIGLPIALLLALAAISVVSLLNHFAPKI